MKLTLQATNIFFEGPKHAGVSRSSLNLLRALLAQREHSFTVLVRPEAPYPKEWDELPNVRVVKITHRTRLWKWLLHDLEPILQSSQYWFSVSGSVPRLTTIPKASLIHDIFFHTYRDTYTDEDFSIHSNMALNQAKSTDFLFSNSESTANQFSEYYSYSRERIVPLPFGTGFESGMYKDSKPLTIRELEELGITGRFILSVSTVEPRKNFPRLVEAFTKCASQPSFDGISLVLVGAKGWKSTGIYEDIAKSSMASRIHFLGYISDELLARLYKTAIYSVVPSLEEGFGLPLLEAMTLGCPTCSSNIGALREVGASAPIYFDPYAVDSMADALKQMLAETAQQTSRELGYEQASNFSWEKSAALVLESFERFSSK